MTRRGRVGLLKPARFGRWVASAPLYRSQRPLPVKAGTGGLRSMERGGRPV